MAVSHAGSEATWLGGLLIGGSFWKNELDEPDGDSFLPGHSMKLSEKPTILGHHPQVSFYVPLLGPGANHRRAA